MIRLVVVRGDPWLYLPRTRFLARFAQEPSTIMSRDQADQVWRLLLATRAYLGRRGGWTQQAMARTARGEAVSAADPHAARYSVLGALERAWIFSNPFRRVTPNLAYDQAVLVLNVVSFHVVRDPRRYLVDQNDQPEMTKLHIHAWLRAALRQVSPPSAFDGAGAETGDELLGQQHVGEHER